MKQDKDRFWEEGAKKFFGLSSQFPSSQEKQKCTCLTGAEVKAFPCPIHDPQPSAEWEKEFRNQFSIKVTPNNEKDTTNAFLLERYWQEHPIGEMVEFIRKVVEQAREDKEKRFTEAYHAGIKAGRTAALKEVVEIVSELSDEVRLHSTGVQPIFAKVVFLKRLNAALSDLKQSITRLTENK